MIRSMLVLLAALALGGCAAIGRTPSHLDTVMQRGTLDVCMTGDYKPFSYYKLSDGTFEGIDVDMAHALAGSLGASPRFVKTSWANLLKDATSGRCDIAMGGVSVTLERQKKAFFSIPILVDGKAPITRCEDVQKYQTETQIDQPHVRVIVNPGGTNEKFARAHLSHAQIIVYPDNVTIFQQIVDGKADVMVTDAIETRLQHKLHPELCAVHPDQPFTFSEKAYLLPRGDTIFKDYVDQWLHLMLSNGGYEKISDRWLK